MSTLLTDTATPTPTVPALVAEPSALAIASALAADVRRTLPPDDVIVRPLAKVASECVSTTLIATAPATVTVFEPWPLELDVEALALLVSWVSGDLPVLSWRD